ncbi:hypothetical protein B0H13DRAFT_1901269 [Mycena leptocephala]|nr:hypothetical protein B0H13DRAFT_1901269 [Mycena leptocephala]
MGGPAGRTIASDIDRACNVLLMMEIEDSEYRSTLRFPSWKAIFIFPRTRSPLAFGAAQNTGVIHLISLQNPDYPSHVEIWNASSSVHLLPPDPPVSDHVEADFKFSIAYQAVQLLWSGDFRRAGFGGSNEFVFDRVCPSAPSQLMELPLRLFSLPEFSPPPSRAGTPMILVWEPGRQYPSSVFYIQMFVNPSFDAAPPAIRDVLAFLDALLERHFPDTKSLDCRAAVPFVKVPSRSATMFLTLSLFMKEYGFEGDEDKSSPADRFVRAADIFRRASSLAARGAGAKIEYDHFRINGELAPGAESVGSQSKFDCRGPLSFDRSRSQYEVFFVDFDTQAELVQYLCRPEVVIIAITSLIRDRFRVRLPLPKDAPWLRRHLANFLHHLTNLSVAEAYPDSFLYCLTYMARLIKKFGYDGDNIEHLEEHFREASESFARTRTTRRWRCPLA